MKSRKELCRRLVSADAGADNHLEASWFLQRLAFKSRDVCLFANSIVDVVGEPVGVRSTLRALRQAPRLAPNARTATPTFVLTAVVVPGCTRVEVVGPSLLNGRNCVPWFGKDER